MKLSRKQLLNMQAIAWLMWEGNIKPKQAEIDEAEKMLLVVKAAFGLTGRARRPRAWTK